MQVDRDGNYLNDTIGADPKSSQDEVDRDALFEQVRAAVWELSDGEMIFFDGMSRHDLTVMVFHAVLAHGEGA